MVLSFTFSPTTPPPPPSKNKNPKKSLHSRSFGFDPLVG